MRALGIVFLAAALLGGCATNEHLKAWEGQPVNLLVEQWGAPKQRMRLDNGNTVMNYSDGGGKCSIVVVASQAGRIKSAIASGHDCP